MTQLYMAAIEQALYLNGSMTADELKNELTKCWDYSYAYKDELGLPTKYELSLRTVQYIIKNLREAYKNEYDIPTNESIRVSRAGGITKYVMCDKARNHLLFPENIFYNKTDREKMNLILKVGEYFSLPMEAFLKKGDDLNKDGKKLFGDKIEVKTQPFDSRVFADVFSAVENHKVISFKYKARTKPQSPSPSDDIVATPYYLKSYTNKWYLIAHVRKSPNRWTVFALDRMSDVKICDKHEPYELDTEIIERFYENVIGFFVPPNPDGSFPRSEKELDIKQITVRMKNESGAFYLEKNPIHDSQRRSDEDPLTFHITCLDNIHLYQELLRILDDIRWIEPPVVRNRLLSKLEEAQNLLKSQ